MARKVIGGRLLWGTMIATAATAVFATMLAVRASAAPVPPTRVGVNLGAPAHWVEDRSFSNLAIYGSLSVLVPGGKRGPLAPPMLGVNGWPANLPADAQVLLPLLVPPGAKAGDQFRCTWQGHANVGLNGDAALVRGDASGLTFALRKDAIDTAHGITGTTAQVRLLISGVTSAAPMADIDCREANRPRDQLFDPQFIRSLAPYRVVRFMDWMNVNSGVTPDFARETMPQRPTGQNSGVPLVNMLRLAVEARIDPWFTIPYSADDSYVHSFAQLTHDRLPPDRTVYVELGNELWNGNFPDARKVQADGLAAGLDTNPFRAQLRQYALRSKHMLDIWTQVYADRPKQLVRVVSGQNFVPFTSETILGFADVAKSVDALGVAPYFGNQLFPADKTLPRPANVDEAFVQLEQTLDKTLKSLHDQKAAANRFGKRLIAYEGGQHVLNKDDLAILVQLNRDPRMGKAYTRYLESWARDVGDTIVLFQMTGPISRFGAWGMEEYNGQPVDQAPKKKAVLDFIAAHEPSRH